MRQQAEEVAPADRGGCASADPTKPSTPDIERYLMAHSSSIHARYGDWLVPDLKAAIECIPADEDARLVDAAE